MGCISSISFNSKECVSQKQIARKTTAQEMWNGMCSTANMLALSVCQVSVRLLEEASPDCYTHPSLSLESSKGSTSLTF
ncbi:hypothetical protein ACU8KH_04460 [Lachancea thermotolerans]